jgi:putative endonuclease
MAQEYWLYMLRCVDGSIYTGATKDLERRMAQHRVGKGSRYVRYRLPRLPAELVWAKGGIPTWDIAKATERRLKVLKHAEKRFLIAGDHELTGRVQQWIDREVEASRLATLLQAELSRTP